MKLRYAASVQASQASRMLLFSSSARSASIGEIGRRGEQIYTSFMLIPAFLIGVHRRRGIKIAGCIRRENIQLLTIYPVLVGIVRAYDHKI